MSENREEIVRRLQRELIGPRFEGATLSNVLIGRDDQVRLAKWLTDKKNFLVLMGSPGCGKTYISSAVLGWMFGKVRSLRYWNERDLFQRIRAFIGSDVKGDYIKEISYILDDDFIVLDDMGSCGLNDWRREVWLEILDTRYELQKPTILTTNFTRSECFSHLGNRSSSRLFSKENCVIDMHGYEDIRQRDPITAEEKP
jgi:DNA replication protein DnaC